MYGFCSILLLQFIILEPCKTGYSQLLLYVPVYFGCRNPISIIYILSRYIYLKNIHEKKARDISQHLPVSASEQRQNLLKITAQNTELIINENDFLCVQSMENYCTFYFLENSSLKKALIRISLANALQQIETGSVKKCHRSYIVNLGRVKKLKGNAQGYKLILQEVDFEIPVSRSFIPSIIPQLQKQNL